MSYKILFSRKSKQQLINLERNIATRIIKKLKEIRENPYAKGVVKLKGNINMFRVRVGKYRVLYEVYEKEKEVVIIKIDKRERVYRNF